MSKGFLGTTSGTLEPTPELVTTGAHASPLELDQYFTCDKLARRIVEWAELSRGQSVLEPSAGDGAFVRAIPKNVRLVVNELDAQLAAQLEKMRRPATVVRHGDFLAMDPGSLYDVAIMNPPYGEGRDGKHVRYALKLTSRVIVLVRVNFTFGSGRFNEVFRWSEVTRRAVLVKRPVFHGPSDKGHTARHDYEVLELVKREDRLKEPEPDRVETEWWTDDWRD